MIICGDSLTELRKLPDESVNCCVTSPPYWGLRDYGTAKWEGGDPECDHKMPRSTNRHRPGDKSTTNMGSDPITWTVCGKCGAHRIDAQLGLEKTPEEYVAKMVEVFREVRRVLRSDGTLWLNLGDSYTTSPAGNKTWGNGVGSNKHYQDGHIHQAEKKDTGLKPKDLVGIPWRVAFALQSDGWVLRQEIIWQKPNPMPESVRDRCTKSHEQIFMFAKARWAGPEPRQFDFISDQDARWLALFLDTEGNICAKRSERVEGRTQYGAQIAFANTSKWLLETAQRIIGKGNLHERGGKNAPMYYYQLSGREAGDLCHRLYPFLIVKQRQARLAIHIQDVLAPSGKKRPGGFRHPDHTAFLEWAWATMKSLNHFGAPDLSDVPEPAFGKWAGCERYWYDAEAAKMPASMATKARLNQPTFADQKGGPKDPHDGNRPCRKALENLKRKSDKQRGHGRRHDGFNDRWDAMEKAEQCSGVVNLRSVWTIATRPFPEAHFATFPPEIPERCIKAGCPKGGTVLDPFFGAGTTGMVALRLGREFIGIELNEEYCRMAKRRIYGTLMESE